MTMSKSGLPTRSLSDGKGLFDARAHGGIAQRAANLRSEAAPAVCSPDGFESLEEAEAGAQAAGEHLQEFDELGFHLVQAGGLAPLQPERRREEAEAAAPTSARSGTGTNMSQQQRSQHQRDDHAKDEVLLGVQRQASPLKVLASSWRRGCPRRA